MTITVNIVDRAYLHSGGTKYYRLTSVSLTNDDTGKQTHALLTNYGPYNAAKGDLTAHKSCYCGTSSMDNFANASRLNAKFNSEDRRRTGRGYTCHTAHSMTVDSKVPDNEVASILRNGPGLITAHVKELLESVDLVDFAPATIESVVEKARKRPRATASAAVPPPAAPEVVIDRGTEWGSW